MKNITASLALIEKRRLSMKFIRLLLLIYLASLSFFASSGDIEMPAPDNPFPVPAPPMPVPDNPMPVSAPDKSKNELIPYPDNPHSVTFDLEKKAKKLK
ncbi:hypothetical protein [Psychromonas sp. SA13A]|uniref:hypothetical protein n=1 Tax=Psychromonas sp. SA13A TaxID=2686346 RepID=UPI00140A3656|nr:hypothetical protein [Psychromonas sp. SA13A]